MKTAMQELIETYASFDTLDQFNDWLCNNEQILLEKEKEQISLAFDEGGEVFADDGHIVKGFEYYNETYNQNK